MPTMTANGQYAIPAWLQAQRDLLAVSSGSSLGLQTATDPGTGMLSSSGLQHSNLDQSPAGKADARAPVQQGPQAAAAASATGMSHDAGMTPYTAEVNAAPIAGSGSHMTNADIVADSAGMTTASAAGPSISTTGCLKGSTVPSSHGSSCELAGMVSPFAIGPPSGRGLISAPVAASEAQQASPFAAGSAPGRDLICGPLAATDGQLQQSSPFAAAPAHAPSRDAYTDHSHPTTAVEGQQQQTSPSAAVDPRNRQLPSDHNHPVTPAEGQLLTDRRHAMTATQGQLQQTSPFAAAFAHDRDMLSGHSHLLTAAAAAATVQGAQQQTGASTEEADTEGLARSGSLLRHRSGSFGGRGAALGHMMEAHQQWRQDSFSRAQVCCRALQKSAIVVPVVVSPCAIANQQSILVSVPYKANC